MSVSTMSPMDRITDYLRRMDTNGQAPRPSVIARLLERLPRIEQRRILAFLGDVRAELTRDVCALVAKRLAIPTQITYTTAPSDYDGFGTETLRVVGTMAGKPVRQVDTPVEHVEWQRQRYGSGLYPAYTAKEFRELIAYPWAQYQEF